MNSKLAIHESESPRPLNHIGNYPIRNGKGGEIGGAYDEFYKVPSTFLFLMY